MSERETAERIFDAFMAISAIAMERDRQKRELDHLRQNSRDVCGGCFLWMKSSMCPREKNVGGWNKGPSMNSPICSKFQPTADHLEWKAKYAAALAQMRAGT